MESLVVPTIGPGELAAGYEGWLYHFNGLSQAIGEQLLRTEVDRDKLLESKADLLAGALGISTQTLITRHTTFPFSRAFARFKPGIPHGSPDAEAKLFAIQNIRCKRAFFCHQCTCDDILSHGRPFWHREHQLPGVYLCHVHFCPLAFTSTDRPFERSPTAHRDESDQKYQSWAERLKANASVMAYTEIALTLIEGEAPLSSYGVVRELRTIAAERGVFSGSQQSLSGLLRQRFDADWLSREIAEFNDSFRTEYPTLEKVIEGRRASVRIPIYVAALSVLYDTPSAAIAGIQRAGAVARDENISARSKLRAEAVHDAWVLGGGTIAGTAKLLGLSRKGMKSTLFANGLPSLDGVRTAAVESFLYKFLDERKSFCNAILTTIDRRTAENVTRRSLGKLLHATSVLRTTLDSHQGQASVMALREHCPLSDVLVQRLATQRRLNIHNVLIFLTKFAAQGNTLRVSMRNSGFRTADVEWLLRIGMRDLRSLIPNLRTCELLREIQRINQGNDPLSSELNCLTKMVSPSFQNRRGRLQR